MKKKMKYMDTKTLESFITYCDNMEIVEESIHTIRRDYKTEMTAINQIKDKLKHETDPKKLLPNYIKIREMLLQLQEEILNDKNPLSVGDKLIDTTGKMIPVVTAIGSLIGIQFDIASWYEKLEDMKEDGYLNNLVKVFDNVIHDFARKNQSKLKRCHIGTISMNNDEYFTVSIPLKYDKYSGPEVVRVLRI